MIDLVAIQQAKKDPLGPSVLSRNQNPSGCSERIFEQIGSIQLTSRHVERKLKLLTYWLITFCTKPLVSSSLWISLWMRKRWRSVNCSKSLACTHSHKKKFTNGIQKTLSENWYLTYFDRWIKTLKVIALLTAVAPKWEESNVKRKSVKWTVRPGK